MEKILAQNGSEAVEAYPAPSVSSRDGIEPETWPGPVLLLEREAAGHGWDVVKAYARGCMPHATTGRPGPERDSYSVRFSRVDRDQTVLGQVWQGYAIYAGSAWQSIMIAGTPLPPFGKLGRVELSAWLADPVRPSSWYDEIRKCRAEAARVAKERAAARPRKGKPGEAS